MLRLLPLHPSRPDLLSDYRTRVLCADCALDEGVIRVRDDLAVEVRRDRPVIQCDRAEVEILPGEIWHRTSESFASICGGGGTGGGLGGGSTRGPFDSTGIGVASFIPSPRGTSL
jgi:hypothetical protein